MRNTNGVDYDGAQTAAKLRIDKRLYSKSALLRTCYWLSKDLMFQIDEEGDFLIVNASLRLKTSTLEHPKIRSMDECLADFFVTLLDSQLRVEIQAETAAVRELIIAKAFAESGVLEDHPPGTFSDPVEAEQSKPAPLIQISQAKPPQ